MFRQGNDTNRIVRAADHNAAKDPLCDAFEEAIRLDERAHIAREVHDSTAQLLAALELELGRLKRVPAISSLADQELTELRAIVHELHLSVRSIGHFFVIRRQDFVQQVTQMAKDFTARTGLSVRTRVDSLPGEASEEIATTLYRVVQEALANVARHAKATTVRLSVVSRGPLVTLRIIDNGIGFNDEPMISPLGHGVVNMRARLNAVSGSLLIRKLRQGSVIEAKVDLRPRAKSTSRRLRIVQHESESRVQ